MIKKTIVLFLLLISLLTFPGKTMASVATLYIGRLFAGNDRIDDYKYNDTLSSMNFSNNEIGFTYIKGLRLSLDFSGGDSPDGSTLHGMELWEQKVGFPVLNSKRLLFYLTAGYLNYELKECWKSEGAMLGGDIVYQPAEWILIEGDCQYSFLGATYRDFPHSSEFPVEQLILKFKTQIIFSKKIGILITYRLLDLNVDSGWIIDDISSPSIGLIYRFK
jgi:hypothetical protein